MHSCFFPVNILVVSPVSYEFARIEFILKIAEGEKKKNDEMKGMKGREMGKGEGEVERKGKVNGKGKQEKVEGERKMEGIR